MPKILKNRVFIFMLRRRRLEFPVIICGNGGGGSAARLTPLFVIAIVIKGG
jgi:hypothetical protein